MSDTNFKKIIIVDDEPDLLDLLTSDFEDEGYEVFSANSYEQAIEFWKKNPDIGVVLSDVRMPKHSGIDLLKQIKKDKNDLLYFFYTGYSDVPLEQAYDLGASAVFQKPTSTASIIEIIGEFVKNRKGQWDRSFERVEATFDLFIDQQTEHPQGPFRTVNIGVGGMFVSEFRDFPSVDEKIHFVIDPGPSSFRRIEGVGICRWVRAEPENGMSSGFGIEFLSFDPKSRNEIIRLINDIQTRAYIPKN